MRVRTLILAFSQREKEGREWSLYYKGGLAGVREREMSSDKDLGAAKIPCGIWGRWGSWGRRVPLLLLGVSGDHGSAVGGGSGGRFPVARGGRSGPNWLRTSGMSSSVPLRGPAHSRENSCIRYTTLPPSGADQSPCPLLSI